MKRYVQSNNLVDEVTFLLKQFYGFYEISDDCYIQNDADICVIINASTMRVIHDDSTTVYADIEPALASIETYCSAHDASVFSNIVLVNPGQDVTPVLAAISSRDLSKNMVRVRSSNIWSYGINVKSNKDNKGDVIVQFKGPNGGPDDIYLYMDVPIKVWKRWITAPSKGHYFWQYIRNNYFYRKLTGDKRGKLRNAIN